MLTSLHIPLRYKLYALAFAAFLFGLLRWRNSAVDRALAKAKEQQRREVDKVRAKSREVADEVEILDDTGLADRASKWMRDRDG